ncbi:unnamed protein product [Spirodela intermedia]|uniref:Uncharacterized protein n=1 Tax=Spirodela intermedia TaxID=51605 RepID=A0A7I8J3Y2_SPIIN|nr:unnamed protein product [Spirodela intermedia]CAA6664771.1 unnamed protein product [Spirodela intermedia]
MGLSSGTIVNEGVQFCVFDLKRGQHEGEEVDKILYFFPFDCPYSVQLSVIGLSEGLITFTRIFSPEAPCEVIEAERHTHVFYQAEPDIWMVMIVEKNKDTEHVWRCDGLRVVLKEVHSLFVMFYGPLQSLLDKQPSGDLARSHLYSFVTDYLTDFHVGKKFQLPSFRESLGERGTIQMLTIEREVAIEVQSLVTVLESCAGRSAMFSSLVLFQNLLVSSTLSPDDTVNVFAYAVMRLTPQALSLGTNSWSYLRRGPSPNVTNLSPLSTTSASLEDHQHRSNDSSSGNQDPNYNVPRALQREKWSKGKDGFLVTDIWLKESGSSIAANPSVWLKQAEQRMFLLIYQHRSMTVVLLVPVNSLSNGEKDLPMLKQQVIENAAQKIVRVEERLSKGWPGENANHVKGYRYLLLDTDHNISRASPPGKVATLTKKEIDLEKNRAERSDSKREKDVEVCVRARNNAWIIARMSRGKELYMVLDKANETILFASDAVEKFSNRYCDGAFSLD